MTDFSNATAGAALTNAAATAGISLTGLEPMAQVQSAAANLLTGIPASTLTGTTLPSNILASSLTSLGVQAVLRVATQTPASAAAAGAAGTIAWDASYLYVCVATNTWTRVAIATW